MELYLHNNKKRKINLKNVLKIQKYIALIISLILLFSCPVQAALITKQKIAKNVKRADIVLVGSSSMSRWTKASKHLSPYKVANLGVGGTKVEEWQKYYTYIAKCKPKAIIVFIGGNNIKTKKDDGLVVARKVAKLLRSINAKNPKAKIFYVSAQPTEKRWNVWKQMNRCNNLLKNWCKTKNKNKLEFIDIRSYCLKNGKPNKSLFCSDKLHFNNKGYDYIYGKIVSTKVKKYMKTR